MRAQGYLYRGFRGEEFAFIFFCDLGDICVNPREWRADFLCDTRDICVNPVGKNLNVFFCNLTDICVNPKGSSSVFCVSPGMSM